MTTELYNLIKKLAYYYQYGKKQYRGYNNILNVDWWDGRTRAVKRLKSAGITREYTEVILRKIIFRKSVRQSQTEILSQPERLAFVKMVNECKFDLESKSSRYNCTGIDWKAFHRPSSSGGWVLIAPDEPGNNWHTKDPILVKYLTQKFINS